MLSIRTVGATAMPFVVLLACRGGAETIKREQINPSFICGSANTIGSSLFIEKPSVIAAPGSFTFLIR